MPRESCLDCIRKHLAQAHVLLDEVMSNPDKYWIHFWFAVGHMAEAESESFNEYPEIAQAIREERIKMMEDDSYWPDLYSLITDVQFIAAGA